VYSLRAARHQPRMFDRKMDSLEDTPHSFLHESHARCLGVNPELHGENRRLNGWAKGTTGISTLLGVCQCIPVPSDSVLLLNQTVSCQYNRNACEGSLFGDQRGRACILVPRGASSLSTCVAITFGNRLVRESLTTENQAVDTYRFVRC
jgi:hypothetical protein